MKSLEFAACALNGISSIFEVASPTSQLLTQNVFGFISHLTVDIDDAQVNSDIL